MFYLSFVLTLCVFFLFFFFSSRRRHTRSLRDWSSDVCSSDLHCDDDEHEMPAAAEAPRAVERACTRVAQRSAKTARGEGEAQRGPILGETTLLEPRQLIKRCA